MQRDRKTQQFCFPLYLEHYDNEIIDGTFGNENLYPAANYYPAFEIGAMEEALRYPKFHGYDNEAELIIIRKFIDKGIEIFLREDTKISLNL